MSYQVLARKWRPSKFAELVGQQHVKSALINGLSQQRLHHAYLFTGTRGVGKTTIARIFAKSLNCEVGVSAEPCGQCTTCVDVDQGRFVDLIEIDAASRTKVGDTREILDNVQYAPTKGRYKVYLIDEVHMLSRHSFNALLKTLEEPPEHVKFLLATTDPQKLPVTILSRCLQFNLQALSQTQISEQLTHILTAEQIPFEQDAVSLLAKYAKGSMRDGLSLTDQAIAQSGQNVQLAAVQQMLGTVDVSWSQNIMAAILQSDSDKLLTEFQRLALQNPDLEKVLDDLLTLCHQIAMTQVMPAAAKLNEKNEAFIQAVAQQIPAQQIQVYYQLLLQGKKDIKLAADMISGFEMICLRLLAFNPVSELSDDTQVKKNSELKLPDSSVELELPESTPAEPVVQEELKQELLPQEQPVQEPEETPEPEQSVQESAAETSNEPVNEEIVSPQEQFSSEEQLSSQEQVSPQEQLSQQEQSDLAAQEAFYHDLAQSQGFQPTEPVAEQQSTANEANLESATEQQPQKVFHKEPLLQEQPSQEQPLQQKNPVSEPVEQPAVQTQQQDFSQIDNPVMAILAARDAHNSAVELEQEKQRQQQAEQQAQEAAEQEVEEPEVEVEPELKPLEHEEVRYAHEVDRWASLIERSGLMGLTRQLALQSAPDINGNHIELTVKKDYAHLLNEKTEAELYDVVSRMAPDCEFVINKSEIAEYSPAAIQHNINENRQERAERSIQQDEFVQTLLNEFDGKLMPDSIKPL